MKLSDFVGAAAGLAIYAEIGLVLFLGAFVAVLFQVASLRRAKDWEEARVLPLSDSDDRWCLADVEGGRTSAHALHQGRARR